MRTLLCAACVGGVLAGLTPGRPANEPARSGLRRPVALALADAGRWLFGGNRNGSVAVIDTDGARGGRAVVADAFGGGLAVVDLARGAVESARTMPGHNLRGLALAADGAAILVSHQGLNRLATSGRDDIHWGNFVTNDLRELSLAA